MFILIICKFDMKYLFIYNFLQWDDPNVVPEAMSLEVSELFTRELTRVSEHCFIFLYISREAHIFSTQIVPSHNRLLHYGAVQLICIYYSLFFVL